MIGLQRAKKKDFVNSGEQFLLLKYCCEEMKPNIKIITEEKVQFLYFFNCIYCAFSGKVDKFYQLSCLYTLFIRRLNAGTLYQYKYLKVLTIVITLNFTSNLFVLWTKIEVSASFYNFFYYTVVRIAADSVLSQHLSKNSTEPVNPFKILKFWTTDMEMMQLKSFRCQPLSFPCLRF